MIKISTCKVKEASRVYGDYAVMDKKAFNISIDPASVIGSVAGGYAATRYSNNANAKQQEKELSSRKLENNTYSQIQSILRDLKIVFTPINVIYSVNGQVFEIISGEEMNPQMRAAFQKKDANYYRNLLVNKINMEIQLAEQAFAKRLLSAGGYNAMNKQSSFTGGQEAFLQLEGSEVDGMVKKASADLKGNKLKMEVSFSSIRPFSQSDFFTDPNRLEKVAGIFDIFKPNDNSSVSLNRLHNEINIGFLPDRVLFVWNGQLVEQMSLLQMNEEGYEAFQKKDKQFFIDFFRENTTATAKNLKKTLPEDPTKVKSNPATQEITNSLAGQPFADIDKKAASLEDIIEDIVEEEFPVIERDKIDIFKDPDIHPIAYDAVLTERYGDDWADQEFEALVKQLEIDFEIRDGIEENPLNKMNILHVLASPDHALYQAPLTFEKFVRAMNSKSVIFEEFQGDLSLIEILFGLEVAKSYDGDEVYLEFHDNIAPYVSEELMNENIRYVSEQLYDETNPSEKDFFKSVNGFLMRKWKERDSQGILDDDMIERTHITSEQIVEITQEVLNHYADSVAVEDPYTSVKTIIVENGLLDPVEEAFRGGVLNMAAESIVAHYMAAIYLEYKHQELEYILDKLREEGVIRER